MGITLSHTSALYALRTLRATGADLMHEASYVVLAPPVPWEKKRWSEQLFFDERWHWERPTSNAPLHAVVPSHDCRIGATCIVSHVCQANLLANSVVWLNELASMVSPELLFVQMASVLSLGELVALGHELCGGFTRAANNPLWGEPTLHIPLATTVERLQDYLKSVKWVKGARRARQALAYVSDGAVSIPEAVLATMYALPPEHQGYGMGPLTLNKQIVVPQAYDPERTHMRYPDILFSFAPVGINYDGEEHLNTTGLVEALKNYNSENFSVYVESLRAIVREREAVRNKYVDDILRDRELSAQGKLILRMVKEDLSDIKRLDSFTLMLLKNAQRHYGVSTKAYEATVQNTMLQRERAALLAQLVAGSDE